MQQWRRYRASQPVKVKLSQCLLPVATAMLAVTARLDAATATWDGDAAVGTKGDGVSWTSANNWTANGVVDSLPPQTTPGDDITFGNGTVGTINLGGNEIANSLNFTKGFTIGAPGDQNVLDISSSTVSVSSGVSATLNSVVNGANGLTLVGPGTLTLNSAIIDPGPTTVNGGTLILNSVSPPGGGSLIVNSAGSLLLNSNLWFQTSLINDGNFTIATGATTTLAGTNISFSQDAGNLVIAGTLNISGASFYDNGGTITGAGTISYSGIGGAFGGTASPTIPAGITLSYGQTSSANRLQLLSNITNNGTLDIIDAGNAPTVSFSTFTLTNSGSLNISAINNATSVISLVGNLNNTGTTNISQATTVSGNITNSGAFTISPSGMLTFANNHSFTQSSGILIIQGALVVSNNENFYDLGGSIGGTVTLQGSSLFPTLTLAPSLENLGAFVFVGNGALAGTGATATIPFSNTVSLQTIGQTSTVQVSGNLTNYGTLDFVSPGNVAVGMTLGTSTVTGTSTLINEGNLTTSATSTPSTTCAFITGNLINMGSTATVNINAPTSISGYVINQSTLTIGRGATLGFTGSMDSYEQISHTTVSTGGVLDLSNAGLILNGGTLTLSADATSPGKLLLSNVSIPFLVRSNIVTGTVGTGQFPGIVDLGGHTVSFTGNGGQFSNTLLISASISDGSISLSNGILQLTGANKFNTLSINAGATTIIGSGTAAGTLGTGAVQNGGALEFERTDSINVTNSISGNGSVTIFSGTVGMNGSNNYSGGTYLSGGTWSPATLSSAGTGPIYFRGGGVQFLSPQFAGQSFDLSQRTLSFDTSAVIDTNGFSPTFVNPIGNGGTGGFTKAGAGTLTLAASVNYSGPTAVTGGKLVVEQVPANSAVTIGPTSTLQFASNAGAQSLSSLSISPTASVDLTNNHLFINYGSAADPIASIAAWIKNGYAGGTWTGAGIISTAAQTNSASYGIGYADSADPGNPAGLSSGQIEIKYTLLGDANLDGAVNGSDFAILAANFNKAVGGWDQGDFNYDGAANGSDFAALASNFNKGASQAADTSLESFATANGLMADVPEPSFLVLGVAAGIGALGLRRRKNL